MERVFNQASVIKLLKEGLTRPNPSDPTRMMWTLEDLDKPSPGWIECVNNTGKETVVITLNLITQ